MSSVAHVDLLILEWVNFAQGMHAMLGATT
jgi:hypothetical protein